MEQMIELNRMFPDDPERRAAILKDLNALQEIHQNKTVHIFKGTILEYPLDFQYSKTTK